MLHDHYDKHIYNLPIGTVVQAVRVENLSNIPVGTTVYLYKISDDSWTVDLESKRKFDCYGTTYRPYDPFMWKDVKILNGWKVDNSGNVFEELAWGLDTTADNIICQPI